MNKVFKIIHIVINKSTKASKIKKATAAYKQIKDTSIHVVFLASLKSGISNEE
jgi:hypothetical protein